MKRVGAVLLLIFGLLSVSACGAVRDNSIKTVESARLAPPKSCVDQGDTDKDGVGDRCDECPGTPENVMVDAYGCPIPLYITLTIAYHGSRIEKDPSNQPTLDRLGSLVKANSHSKVRIEGHTDSYGPAGWRNRRSQIRAEGIKNYLVRKVGAPADRVDAVGMGGKVPLVSNDTEYGRRRNHRVKISLTGYYQRRAAQKAKAAPPAAYVIQFGLNRTDLDLKKEAQLREMARHLKENPGTVADIAGYTDTKGPEELNLEISRQRAEKVKRILAREHGIDEGRLLAIGYGEKNPVADNSTLEGRRKNRRVAVRIISPEGIRLGMSGHNLKR